MIASRTLKEMEEMLEEYSFTRVSSLTSCKSE
jgi:hypothetical protein